jgi:hypothetical protein
MQGGVGPDRACHQPPGIGRQSQRVEDVAPAGATKSWRVIGRGDLNRQKHGLRIFGEQILPLCARTGQHDGCITGIGGDARWRLIRS